MKKTQSAVVAKPLKIALFGKRGMLGSQFEKILQELAGTSSDGTDVGVELFAFDSSEMDITDHGKMKKFFDEVTPDFAINCTGYTNVDKAESEKSKAFAINADALKIFIDLCKRFGTILIHFSTDYVFDGRKTPPDGYKEKDIPDPLNTYGESKFRGEEIIQDNMSRFYIVRTSWLYGPLVNDESGKPRGRNFVTTMLSLEKDVLSRKKEAIKVVGDQIGAPTYSFDLAKAVVGNFIEPFLLSENKLPPSLSVPPFGIYHLTNSGVCSWFDFASKILTKTKPIEITSSQYVTDAQRPKNSILINTKLPKLRPWEEALDEYLREKE